MLFVNVTDGIVNMRFGLRNNIGIKEYSYSLGDELFKFLSFDIGEVYSLYIEIAEAFMDFHYGEKNETAYEEKLAVLYGELDSHSIYLHLYTNELLEHMIELQAGYKYAMESFLLSRTVLMQDMSFRFEQLIEDKNLKPYFDLDTLEHYHFDSSKMVDPLTKPLAAERDLYKTEVKMGRIETESVSKSVMEKAIGLAILFLAEDLKRKRAVFLGDIAAITDSDASLDGFSLTQKLYLLDIRRESKSENRLYERDLWKTVFMPYPHIPYDLTEEEAKEYILKNNVEIKQVHEITSMDGLIVFELLTLLTNGATIKKCKYCGNFFVPQGRSDTVFCDRVAKGETKPCRIIGSLKLHKAAKADNPIHEAHQKAYRRMNSKARTKRISQNEFLIWSDEARSKRDACLNGELPFEVFAQWLDLDKAK